MSTEKLKDLNFVAGEPLTTTTVTEVSPTLNLNAIDQRIVRVRPMSTPIDQLSRWATTRRVGAMTVDYYCVEGKPAESIVKATVEVKDIKSNNLGGLMCDLQVEKPDYFDVSDTLLLPGIVDDEQGALVLYVQGKTDTALQCMVLNREAADVQAIEAKQRVVRMARAAAELDVQTAQFEAVPTKKTNFCQIFKMQVEQSTYQKMVNKEVGWTFSDQEESAIIDMRLAMERSFLFGAKAKCYDTTKHDDIMFTGGIWNQCLRQLDYDAAEFTPSSLVDICRQVFTGQSGSKRKVLVAGSGLIETLSNLEYNKVVQAGQTKVKWGLEFNEIHTQFGSLFVIHSEVFDQCGHADDGFILDPDYLTKFVHVPFRADRLDLRTSGTRNTDAIVLTEASCLVLRYPDAHCRLVAMQ